ncbi:MAG TPA: DUF2703 domain-containing protein [Clostridia bacterium]|nr:DUF2703 domain-containing protein [Clostridia bacterium]
MSNCSGCSSCSTCGGGTCEPEITKMLKLNMVFDDETDSEKCDAMDGAVNEALESMRDFLNENRIKIQYSSVKLINREQAELLGFENLPTILINGTDIQPGYKENTCKCHPDQVIKGWIYMGMEMDTPPKELITDALIEAIYGKPEKKELEVCDCSGESS